MTIPEHPKDSAAFAKGLAEFTRDGNRKLAFLLFLATVIIGILFWSAW